MPDWLVVALLILFAVHLAVFFRLFLKRGEKYYLAASFTFLLLVLTFAVRLWWAEAAVAGYSLFWILRIAAWISAAFSISWLIKRRIAKKRAASA